MCTEAQLLELNIAELGPNFFLPIFTVFIILWNVYWIIVPNILKQRSQEKNKAWRRNSAQDLKVLEKCQSHVKADAASLNLQGVIFFPLQVEQLCLFYAHIAKQDASVKLSIAGKLTTWVLLCYFLLLHKSYILLTTPTAVSIKKEISKHCLKRWNWEKLWDFLS